MHPMAVTAYRRDRLAFHLGERAGTAAASGAELVTRVKVATSEVARLLQSQPREAIPQIRRDLCCRLGRPGR